MRVTIVLLVSVLMTAAGCSSKSTSTAVTLEGTILNADRLVLTKVVDINRNNVELVKHIEINADGSFGTSVENLEPHLYELNFPNGKKSTFVAEPGQAISFNGDATSGEIAIKGSAANDLLARYEQFRRRSLDRLVKSVRAKIKALPAKEGPEWERLSKLEVSNYVKHKDELFDHVSKNMSDSISLYATSSRWPADAKRIRPLVAGFERKYPDLEITQRMKEKLAVIEQTSVGGTAPDIKMRDETGNEISLYDSKGKYTLIDFWGSWCGPCRREAATLSGLYEEYKGRGFEIFGVGLESEMRLWKEAKQKDKRIWPNVLSLKEFETEAAYDYAITSLPANFLIDEDGTVVAKDVHDEQLTEKLAELFGRE